MSKEITDLAIHTSNKKFNNKYDFSLVEEISSRTDEVQIICPIHGSFKTTFIKHLGSGHGCNDCGKSQSVGKRRMTFESFIELFNSTKPNDSYKILNKRFKTESLKKEVVYVQTEFGICKTTAINLKEGRVPSIITSIDKLSFFVTKYRNRHGYNHYDFSDSKYIGVNEPMSVKCKIHGVFTIIPNRLLSGEGCAKCGNERTRIARTSNTEEFIVKAMSRLGTERGIYKEFEYVTAKTKSKIWCPTHNDFYMITPNDHLTGYSCGFCNTGGYNGKQGYKKLVGAKKSKVYIILCENTDEKFYKIGITCNNLSVRYSRYKYGQYFDYTEVLTVEFDADVAWDTEKELLYKYKNLKYTPKEKFDGCTECFTLDLPIEEIKLKLSQK